tara:strand:+ start:668 stop:775 length:108 start_codon:yes stop_codon:yes gene_type:complete
MDQVLCKAIEYLLATPGTHYLDGADADAPMETESI